MRLPRFVRRSWSRNSAPTTSAPTFMARRRPRNVASEVPEFDGDRYGCAAELAPCSIAAAGTSAASAEPAELRPPLSLFAFVVPCVLLPLLAASALPVPPTEGVPDDAAPPFPRWPC